MKKKTLIDIILEDAEFGFSGYDVEESKTFALDDILNHLDDGNTVVISGVSEYDEGDIELTQHTLQQSSDYPYESGRSWMSFILDEGNHGGIYKEVAIHPNNREESGLYITYATTEDTGLSEDEYPEHCETGYVVTNISEDEWGVILIEVEEDHKHPKHLVL